MGDILYISQLVVFAGMQVSLVFGASFLKLASAFSALRVFALWDGNIPTTLLVSLLNLVPVAMNIVSVLPAFHTARYSPWLVYIYTRNTSVCFRLTARFLLRRCSRFISHRNFPVS